MSDIPPHSPQDPYLSQSGADGPEQAAPSKPAAEPLWTRALYMLLFAVIGYFLLLIFLAVCLLQIIVMAVSEKPNAELKEFLRNILAYIGVTLAYLAFLDEKKPFPFSPFPHPLRD